MKKIVSLLMCLIFCAACLTGCANSNEAFTEKSYTADAEKVTEICVDVRDRQIEVTLSTDDQIHIDYFENSKEYYNISISDAQVLTMTAASDKDWTDYIGGKSAVASRKISLQVPDALSAALKLSTTNEDISLAALNVAADLSLSSYGGNIVFDKLGARDSIYLSAKNGDISGSIIGSYDDYAILCDIKKGKSNLPSSKENGTKTLAVSNNNGNIDIEFVR